MTWLIFVIAALVAGALSGRIMAAPLAKRFPSASNKWIAIGAAAFVSAVILGLAVAIAAVEYMSVESHSAMTDLPARGTIYVGLVCALVAGVSGEMAARWALRRRSP